MKPNNITTLEYVWLDANSEFRSKIKVVYEEIKDVENVPIWNYDGSSTGQAETNNSEIFLHPAAIYNDPFMQQGSESEDYSVRFFLVWCETRTIEGVPLKNSNRTKALEVLKKYENEEPWFGLEQEYVILERNTDKPYHFSHYHNTPNNVVCKRGKFYCGVGASHISERNIAETHMAFCIYAGIAICGLNAEVAPGQWEYQIGPCESIKAGDDLWMSRYILNRCAELIDCSITYHPKPLLHIGKEYNGSGCHTNFSTKAMRAEGGIKMIMDAMSKLEPKHDLHISNYGENNELRLTGENETASISRFSYGIGSRTTSIRIPNIVAKEGKGYFEDRRPASNCDPYLVTMLIAETCCHKHEEKEEGKVAEKIENKVFKTDYNFEDLHEAFYC
jgi:glutamine synthetase